VFASAFIKTYEAHEEDAVRRCFFSVTRDEQNHEQMCGLAITKLLEHPDPMTYEPKTDLGRRLQKNAKWLYFNGGRYWTGYKQAVPKYSLAVLFSSFLMGEIAAATIFHQMAAGCTEPVFKAAFRNIGRTRAATWHLHGADGARLPEAAGGGKRRHHQADPRRLPVPVGRAVRAADGVLGPARDFIDNQREGEKIAREAGFAIPAYEARRTTGARRS
jgi:hypothetical protein